MPIALRKHRKSVGPGSTEKAGGGNAYTKIAVQVRPPGATGDPHVGRSAGQGDRRDELGSLDLLSR